MWESALILTIRRRLESSEAGRGAETLSALLGGLEAPREPLGGSGQQLFEGSQTAAGSDADAVVPIPRFP